VQLDQLGIDGLHRSLPSGNNQLGDFIKAGIWGRRDGAEVIHVKAFLLVGDALSSTPNLDKIEITKYVEVKRSNKEPVLKINPARFGQYPYQKALILFES
jgi:hypothetical protein